MRKIYLLVSIIISSATLSAQKVEQINSQIEKKFEGYIILTKPAPAATFLFDILKNGQLVYQQINNPFTRQPEGFQTKDDAFKVAEWLIKEFKTTQHFSREIPPHVAQQYKIRIIRGTKPNQN